MLRWRDDPDGGAGAHCNVPQREEYEGVKLGRWVLARRQSGKDATEQKIRETPILKVLDALVKRRQFAWKLPRGRGSKSVAKESGGTAGGDAGGTAGGGGGTEGNYTLSMEQRHEWQVTLLSWHCRLAQLSECKRIFSESLCNGADDDQHQIDLQRHQSDYFILVGSQRWLSMEELSRWNLILADWQGLVDPWRERKHRELNLHRESFRVTLGFLAKLKQALPSGQKFSDANSSQVCDERVPSEVIHEIEAAIHRPHEPPPTSARASAPALGALPVPGVGKEVQRQAQEEQQRQEVGAANVLAFMHAAASDAVQRS